VDALRLSGNLAFGKVPVGSTTQSSFTLFNDSASPITVSSISYPQGFSGVFSGQIPAASSRIVAVNFSPTAAQLYSGNLTVNCDAPTGTKTLPLSGEGVASLVTLTSNTPVTNLSGTPGTQTVYKIAVPAGTTKLEVSLAGPNGDADLYLKRGAAPTLTVFDSKADGPTSNEAIAVNNPATAEWFILVHAYSAYSGATLKAVCASSYPITLSVSGQGRHRKRLVSRRHECHRECHAFRRKPVRQLDGKWHRGEQLCLLLVHGHSGPNLVGKFRSNR
jgi:hypothetical protein